MHYKKPMEFTSKQNSQLKQLDVCRLQPIQAKYEEFNKELENLITERSNCLNEREILMNRLTSIQEDLKNAQAAEYDWQKKLETVNRNLIDDQSDKLKSFCLLLGFKISKSQILENNGLQITLNYRDTCYVTYTETAQVFDLIEVCPQHFNFSQIKEFLQNSQDLRGLLRCLRKFFDFVLDCKEKQEQK